MAWNRRCSGSLASRLRPTPPQEGVGPSPRRCKPEPTTLRAGSSTTSKPLSALAMLAVRGYQVLIAPLLPPSCRYFPSCSHYALMAYEKHGAWRGTTLTLWRLLRCQPLARGGYDPVP